MERLYVETKLDSGDDGAIEGKAWDFGSGDRIGDWIEPGAFKGAKLPLPLLFGHDQNDPVGVWEAMSEARGGLIVKGRLLVDEVARAREVRALVRSGAVTGLSIGYVTKKATARAGGGRTIKSLDLLEVSLVTLPMHPGARVTSAKSAVQAIAIVEAITRATARIAAR
ncbi:MAG: HK97 family phage prohead protease [Rhodovulum sp.]|nr:HK97 family phage prohead protease [Rhodovulum sp.]